MMYLFLITKKNTVLYFFYHVFLLLKIDFFFFCFLSVLLCSFCRFILFLNFLGWTFNLLIFIYFYLVMGKFASLDIPQSAVCLFLMFLPHLKLHAVEFNLFRNKTHYHHQSGHDLAQVLLFLLFFPQNPSSPLRHPFQYIKFISSHNYVALKILFSSFSSFFFTKPSILKSYLYCCL